MNNICPRCNKIIVSATVVTVNKQVGKSRLERFCNLCSYCTEELEEFLQKPKGSE